MKSFIASFIFLAISNLLCAQNEATISGRIYDNGTNQILPYSTVVVLSEEEIINGAITGEDGRFVIEGIEQGEYTVRCSFIGFADIDISILIGELNTNYDLGRIVLVPSEEVLDEISVNARREILSAELDKQTYQVSENIAQSGGSVLDIMKTMPGITVDQEGKVMLRGSDKVMILIDGKQSSLTGFGTQKGLETIPSSNIESIEIINNPSARYDASGMAGIINILYKKENKEGWSADAIMTFGLGRLSKNKEDLPTSLGSYSLNPKLIPGINLNYRTDKVHLFLLPEAMFLKNLPNNEFTTRTYDNNTKTVSQVPENRTQQHYIVNGGLDWYVDDNNTFTISGIYDWESHVDTAEVPYINMITNSRYRFWSWNEEEITGYMNYALNYNHRFAEPGHELNASVQYTKGWEDETYFLNDSSALRIGKDKTHILAKEHTTSVAADYINPLPGGRFETGAKLQWRRLPVEYTVTPGNNSIIYPNMGDWSDWGEDIYAAYLNYVYEKTLFDIEGGIRAEYTKVFYDISPENVYYPHNDSYDYFELFPNIRLTLKPNTSNSISLFYNRRIDRPGEPELRIFPKYDDPELLKVGNPYLRPQYTQIFEMTYRNNWISGSASISGYHRLIKDAYQRIYSIDESNENYSIVNKIYQNTGEATNTGFELIISQLITSSWNFSGSLNWYKNTIDGYQGILYFPYERSFTIGESEDNTWDFKINNQIDLNDNFQIQLTGLYYAPKDIPQGRQLARSSIDLGIQQTILQGKGEITFTFSDIFNDFKIRQNIKGNGFTALYENYYETQVARLGFKYSF